MLSVTTTLIQNQWSPPLKVIIEKSRGEGSLMEQDTIENLTSFYVEYVFTVYNVF